MEGSDASAKSFTVPANNVRRKGAEIVFIMNGTLWENNLNFVKAVAMQCAVFHPRTVGNPAAVSTHMSCKGCVAC